MLWVMKPYQECLPSGNLIAFPPNQSAKLLMGHSWLQRVAIPLVVHFLAGLYLWIKKCLLLTRSTSIQIGKLILNIIVFIPSWFTYTDRSQCLDFQDIRVRIQ